MASEERGLSEKGLGATVMKVVCSLCLQSRPQIISKFSYIVIILLNTRLPSSQYEPQMPLQGCGVKENGFFSPECLSYYL